MLKKRAFGRRRDSSRLVRPDASFGSNRLTIDSPPVPAVARVVPVRVAATLEAFANVGEMPAAGAFLSAVNPATRELMANVFVTPTTSIAAIVARAQSAGSAWRALSVAQRAQALRRLRDAVARRALEIGETIARGMGKPLIEALSFEVSTVIEALDACMTSASGDPAEEPVAASIALPAHPPWNRTVLFRQAPRAVVCVIAPVSSPFDRAMTPAVAALATGSAVIIKPTSAAPLVGALIERLFDEAFIEHPGLVQVVFGGAALGVMAATADGVDAVIFAGSRPVGLGLQQALAPLRRPGVFELRATVPLIVCDDANLERAAAATVYGRFSNNGQGDATVNRVYVLRAVAETFISKVIHKVRALKSGPYTDPFSRIGPLANGSALENLRTVLQDALDQRAVLVAGGFPAHVTGHEHGERLGADRKGWFWPPTVVTEVNHAMRVMKEQVFGPILGIQVVDDDREAVALANDTENEPDVCVFTADMSRADQIAEQLHASSVTVNDVLVNIRARSLRPFDAQRCFDDRIQGSGDARDPARTGPRLFSVRRSVLIDAGNNDAEPHWFPYTAAKLQALERALMEGAGK